MVREEIWNLVVVYIYILTFSWRYFQFHLNFYLQNYLMPAISESFQGFVVRMGLLPGFLYDCLRFQLSWTCWVNVIPLLFSFQHFVALICPPLLHLLKFLLYPFTFIIVAFCKGLELNWSIHFPHFHRMSVRIHLLRFLLSPRIGSQVSFHFHHIFLPIRNFSPLRPAE